MGEEKHLHGNSDEWTRCGIPIGNVGISNVTNNVEVCTCRKCAMYMLRDSMNRYLLFEER